MSLVRMHSGQRSSKKKKLCVTDVSPSSVAKLRSIQQTIKTALASFVTSEANSLMNGSGRELDSPSFDSSTVCRTNSLAFLSSEIDVTANSQSSISLAPEHSFLSSDGLASIREIEESVKFGESVTRSQEAGVGGGGCGGGALG